MLHSEECISGSFFKKMNEFEKARLKLTLWYILISALLLAIFTAAAIAAEQRAFSAILNALADPVQRPYLTSLLERRISTFESNFRRLLFSFDLLLLAAASVTSYFLSGRTLEPIAQSLKQQEEFAADASHELRTPLTTIGMEIEALKRTQKKMPEKYKQVLGNIEEEIIRMRGLVDGLLTLVRADNKNVKSNISIFDLSKLTQEVYHQLKPLAKSKQIDLKLEANSEVRVYAKPQQIKELIIILVDNAIKFTPSGKFVNLATLVKDSHPTLEVSDQGIGITPSDLPHIFDRFYQGYQSSKIQKGSGLGLSIAKKITDINKAKISVESQVSLGTTFTVTFPKLS